MVVGPSATSTVVTTSATTSTTSSSTSSSSSGSRGAQSFSANGTAALILAFLAIGLFVGGMLTMIGLRRRALGRAQRWMMNEEPSPVWTPMGSEAEDDVRSRARRKKKDVGPPPKLYDIYAPAKGIESAFWRDVLPLSAKSISHSTPHICASESEDIAQGGHRRWHFDALGFFHWPPGPTHPLPTAPPRPKVQVAVVVAMPAPVDAEPLGPDFTLGLTQLSWNHDVAVPDIANVATLVDG